MRYRVLLLSALAVAACTSAVVELRNEKTGDKITCGGQLMLPGRPSGTDRCVKLMKGAGYQPVEKER